MNDLIVSSHLVGMIAAIAAALDAERDRLNALDAALGDGDHGTSISTAFNEAARQVAGLTDALPSGVLKVAAMTLMNRMGGASGALFGTLFLGASQAVDGKDKLSADDLVALWASGLMRLSERGRAQRGDKTMLDALAPAVEAMATADADIAGRLRAAANAAQAGAESTAAMEARHGRAKYAGARAIGQIDAGAASVALMFRAMSNYWDELRKENAHGQA